MRSIWLVLAIASVSACAGRYRTASPHEDRLQRQLDVALRTRAQLVYYFVQAGAVARPPMPELVAEEQGPEPYAGALWTPGRWVWGSARWTWEPGAWGEGDVFTVGDVAFGGDLDDDGYFSDGDNISNPPPLGCACPAGGGGVRDHRASPHDWGARIRDHRTHEGKTKLPSWASPSYPEATVRDHRTTGGGDAKSYDAKSSGKDKDKHEDGGKDFGSGGHFHR
jgi:hypothetical protein